MDIKGIREQITANIAELTGCSPQPEEVTKWYNIVVCRNAGDYRAIVRWGGTRPKKTVFEGSEEEDLQQALLALLDATAEELDRKRGSWDVGTIQ